MDDKRTRGRASKVDQLPPEIKTQLAIMLRDKQYSQTAILNEINALIKDAGLPDDLCLSRTGLNRYASKVEQMGQKIRESREIAAAWTKQFGETQSDLGQLLMEMVKTLAFDHALALKDGEFDPKHLAQLALIAARLEQAQTINHKREQAIRKELAQLAADTAEATAIKAGVSAETVSQLKAQILGIA